MNDLKNLITGSQRADLKSFVHKYIGNNDYAQSVNLDEFFEQNYDDFCKTQKRDIFEHIEFVDIMKYSHLYLWLVTCMFKCVKKDKQAEDQKVLEKVSAIFDRDFLN
jgi:hypothetical protein